MTRDQQEALESLRRKFDPQHDTRTAVDARKALLQQVAEVVAQVETLTVEQVGDDTWYFGVKGSHAPRRAIRVKAGGFDQFSVDRQGKQHGSPLTFDEKDLSWDKVTGRMICVRDYDNLYNEEKISAVRYLVDALAKALE